MTTNKTEKKPTKRDHFNALLNIAEVAKNDALVDFINHEIDLLNRKNSADRKPTATQVANDGLKANILTAMEDNRLYSISEMIKTFPCCAELSTPKVSAIIHLLMADGKVERIEEKRKAYFRKIVE